MSPEELLRAAGVPLEDVRKQVLLAAPEFGGNYGNSVYSLSRNNVFGSLGQYDNTAGGKNTFGYVGQTPINIGQLGIGGAVGGFQNKDGNLNGIIGLLLAQKIRNGELRILASPAVGNGQGSIFVGYDHPF